MYYDKKKRKFLSTANDQMVTVITFDTEQLIEIATSLERLHRKNIFVSKKGLNENLAQYIFDKCSRAVISLEAAEREMKDEENE